MFRTVCLPAGVAVAALFHPAAALAQQAALDADAIAFGTREGVSNMDLSPDGTKAVFTAPGPGRTTIIYVADLGAGTTKPILSSLANPEALRWCAFVSDRRLACKFSAIVNDGEQLIPAARTISVDTDGKNVKELGQRASTFDVGLRQYDGSIIDWLPGAGDEILMSRTFVPEGYKDTPTLINRTKAGVGVVKVDATTLRSVTVEQPRDAVDLFMSDGRGNVRLLGIDEMKSELLLSGRVKYLYRTPGSRDWRDLRGYQKDEFVPLAIDADSNALFVLTKKAGRYALSKMVLNGSPVATEIVSRPDVDIDNVVRSSNGQKVIGYTYTDDRARTVYFDPEYKALAASLGKAIPNLPTITFINSSDDGNKVLLFAAADNSPGAYYLFDKRAKTLGQVMAVRPQLDSRTLATVRSITYRAADGTAIPAYLTLPPGKPAKGLPAVVLPHGGPSARDEWGFDWLPQFLAARGYAVIQPNYRGSAGYGDAWMAENGFKGWRTSIGDVSSAARYLVSEGIADPKRLAIVGWSYGGYAALQSAATEPTLYKAVVAIAPVTDLDMLKTEAEHFTSSRMTAQFVGTGAHVVEGSPLRHAAAIQAPVLLVHGDKDINVGVYQSIRMDAALKAAGKSSELLKFDGLDHQLDDSQARALLLSKMGALLDKTIGH